MKETVIIPGDSVVFHTRFGRTFGTVLSIRSNPKPSIATIEVIWSDTGKKRKYTKPCYKLRLAKFAD